MAARARRWTGSIPGKSAWMNPNTPSAPAAARCCRLRPRRYAGCACPRATASAGSASPSGWLAELRQELLRGLKLVQFREPDWNGDPASLREAFSATLSLCRQHGARCLVNSAHPVAWWSEADGVQLRAADAARVLQDDTR